MPSNNSPHSKRFQQLLDEIKQEVDGLKANINYLKNENERLKLEIKDTKDKEADVFSSMKETERIALKHQVKGLISKIDEHLEGRA